MKKLILGLLSLTLFIGTVQAQDGKKAFSKAKKAQGLYNLDPQTNKAKLGEAMAEIDRAIQDSDISKECKNVAVKRRDLQ